MDARTCSSTEVWKIEQFDDFVVVHVRVVSGLAKNKNAVSVKKLHLNEKVDCLDKQRWPALNRQRGKIGYAN